MTGLQRYYIMGISSKVLSVRNPASMSGLAGVVIDQTTIWSRNEGGQSWLRTRCSTVSSSARSNRFRKTARSPNGQSGAASGTNRVVASCCRWTLSSMINRQQHVSGPLYSLRKKLCLLWCATLTNRTSVILHTGLMLMQNSGTWAGTSKSQLSISLSPSTPSR